MHNHYGSMSCRPSKRTHTARVSPLEELEVPDRIVSFFHDRFREVPIDVFDIVFYEYLDTHIKGRSETLADTDPYIAPCHCTTAPADCRVCHIPADRQRLWQTASTPALWTDAERFFPHSAVLVKTHPRDRVRRGDFYLTNFSHGSRKDLWTEHRNIEVIPHGAVAGACFLMGFNTHASYGGSKLYPVPQLVVVHSHPQIANASEAHVHGQLVRLTLPAVDLYYHRSITTSARLVINTHRTPHELGILLYTADGHLHWSTVPFVVVRGNIRCVNGTRQCTLVSTDCRDQPWPLPYTRELGTCTKNHPNHRCQSREDAVFYDGTIIVVTHATLLQYDWGGALLRRLPLRIDALRQLIHPRIAVGVYILSIRRHIDHPRGLCVSVMVQTKNISDPWPMNDFDVSTLLS